MKYTYILILTFSIIVTAVFFSCSTGMNISEDPVVPFAEIRDNNSGEKESADMYYTSQSTVSDVLNDPYFENFGRLLFPVDRNISPSITLAQVSTSSVYMWYPYIQVDKTVEILNYLHSQAAKGKGFFIGSIARKK